MNTDNLDLLYKRGIIDNKEYERKLKELELDSALKDKLEREFKEFKKELKKLPKYKIMEKAYELTAKEKIKDYLINMDLHETEKELLFLQDDTLKEFYHDWLDCDVPLGDSMKDCIEESVATLTKYFGKNLKSKER